MRNGSASSFPRLLSLLVLAGIGLGGLAMGASENRDPMFGFDMWCLEMELHPAARCNLRRPDDLKEYDQYRRSLEQYQQEREVREKREKELKDKLGRDPLNVKREPFPLP